jgi:predicted ester cyclase
MDDDRRDVVVRRYYDEMWNRWNFDLAGEILVPEIRFRGSLGTEVRGVEEFQAYMRTVQSAFPDFHNRIDELIVEGDRAAARLTYEGTHRGEIFGAVPTDRRITYAGAAFFRFSGDRIAEAWVLGDVYGLQKQLGVI